jgi:hypothetical protein
MANELQRLAEELLMVKTTAAKGAEGAQTQSKTMVGTVVSVNDPLGQGRIQVIPDEFSPNDTGQTSSYKATPTSWIATQDGFIGKQSSLLVGQRVVLSTVGNDPNKLVVGNVVHDENSGAPAVGTTMTKLPLYPSGSLPKPCPANLGCQVVELDGPMKSDWLCVCLRRNGEYLWVRHIDLNHGHAGQNDGQEKADRGGDMQTPEREHVVWDYVFPTTEKELEKQSIFGTSPRENPWGDDAKWYGGAV